MSTYAELRAKAEEMMRQAEDARKAELAQVVQGIKQQIKEYSIRIEDLFPDARVAAPRSSRTKKVAKFQGPNGEQWTGGPGRKPAWVHAVIESGQDINKYRI
jgi:DNA-binding protein H-NS